MRGVHAYPHADRYALAWFVLGLALALAVVVAPGCALPAKVEEQLRVDTAAADRVVELWPALTPEKRFEAYLKMRQGAWVLRYVLTGQLPDEDLELRTLILELGGEQDGDQ